MPKVTIQGFGDVNFPDSMTPEQIQGAIENDILAKPNPANQAQYPEATPVNNFMAGVGKGMVDVGRGIGERLGLVSPAQVDAARKVDAPLMATTAGNVGSLAGNLAIAAPTAFIPGANTVLGASMIGAGLGASQPTGTGESAIKNAAIGGALGGVGQYGLGKLGDLASNRLAAAQASAADTTAQNAVRDSTLQSAQAAGYRVPPVQANPTLGNRMLEGFAGKLSTAQSASLKNQPVTDALIKSDLGLPANKAVTVGALQQVRSDAGKAYEVVKQAGTLTPDEAFASQISNLGGPDYASVVKDFPEMANPDIAKLSDALSKPSFSANSAVSLIKQLRNDAASNFKNRMDPQKLALAGAQSDAATALEDLADRTLTAAGNPDAVQKFRDARKLIAQAHAAEGALNPATGSFSAADYAKLYDKGKPLTAGALQVGRFASAFPAAAKEVATSMPGVSPLDYATVGTVSAATHNPGILGAILGRPLARGMILSRPYQAAFAQPPNYAPGLLTRAAPPTLEELRKLGVSGLLGPSIYAAQQ